MIRVTIDHTTRELRVAAATIVRQAAQHAGTINGVAEGAATWELAGERVVFTLTEAGENVRREVAGRGMEGSDA